MADHRTRHENDVDEELGIDERDDDDDDDEAETVAEVAPSIVADPVRPRARAAAAAPVGPLSNFGGVPQGVTHWGIKRRTSAGTWETLPYAPPGSTVALREWPLAELSEQTLRERWGVGAYRAQWIVPQERGGRRVLQGGRIVEIVRPEVEAAPSTPTSASGIPGLEDGLRFMKIVKECAASNLSEVLQLAQFFGAGQQRGGGLTGEELRAIMRDEREAAAASTQAAIRAAVEPLERRLADLADEDDEDEDDRISDAARAAGPALFKGRKWWQQLGAFMTQNPEVVKAVAPVVAGAVQNVASVIAGAVSTPPPRPRAVMAQHAPSSPPPSPPMAAPFVPVDPVPAASRGPVEEVAPGHFAPSPGPSVAAAE